MKRAVLGVIILGLIVSVVGTTDHASAANERNPFTNTCNPNGSYEGDVKLFPYGYFCGTHPSNQAGMPVSVTNVTDGTTVTDGSTVLNGSVLSITIGWNGVTGPPMRNATDNDPSHPNAYTTAQAANLGALFFATINAENASDSRTINQVFPSGASPGGARYDPCPGDDSGKFGKIWGDRDLRDHDYNNNSVTNGNNQSPYAYHQGESQGVINCQDHGKMVYWMDGAATTKSYSFDILLGDELVSDSICIRGNLSIRFGGDQRWFPEPSGANSPAPYIGPGSPLTPADNGNTTATHLVKQSPRLCFSVALRPTGKNFRATFLAECDRVAGTGRIYGHISEYNSAGNYVRRAAGVFVTLEQLNLGSNVDTSNLGSDTTDASGNFSINLPFNSRSNVPSQTWNASQVFDPEHTDRSFQLIISRGGSAGPPVITAIAQQPLPATGMFYRAGAQLNCRNHPPVLNVNAVCEDGRIYGNAIDPDNTSRNLEVHIFAHGLNDRGRITPLSGINTDDLKNFSFDITALQDGYNYSFDVIAVDDISIAALNTGVTVNMQGCGQFQLDPGAGGSLQPSDEDPTNFAVLNTITPGYPGWAAGVAKPAVTANAQNSLTKNGGAITGTGFPTYTTFISRDFNSGYNIPAGSFVAGDAFCTNISITPYSGIIRNDGVILRETVHTRSANGCDTVANKPFFKVYGGSVSAGGNFSAAGPCNGGGVLSGFYRNDSVNPAFKYGQGSSTELAALGIGQITGFASAQKNVDKSPIELSFANSGVAWPVQSDPKLGGLYGGDHCLDNAEPPSKATAITSTLPGGSTINATTVPIGVNRSIFVNGDVYIGGDITYAGATGGWTPDNVPSMVIKARGGNIYIDNDVKNLDGVYIAEATGAAMNKGQIYTCSTAVGAQVAQNDLYDNCYKQLTVHGNFVARKVNLMRTYGSLRDEKPTAGTPKVDPGPDQPGVKNRPIWSEYLIPGGSSSSECIPVFETAESPSGIWTDNYLCLDPDDIAAGIRVGWNSANGTPNDELGRSLTHCEGRTATEGNLKFIQNLGESAGNTWYDNNLCSNVEINVGTAYNLTQAEAAPGGPWLCDQMYDNGDNHIPYWKENNNIKIFICLKKFVAGGPGSAAVLPAPRNPLVCSNSRPGSKSYIPTAGRPDTCAAEVFDFSPEFYLSQPSIKPPSGGAIIYDSITSLPPVL